MQDRELVVPHTGRNNSIVPSPESEDSVRVSCKNTSMTIAQLQVGMGTQETLNF